MSHPAAPPVARHADPAAPDPADRPAFSEYESEPVPPHARRRTASVAAVWLGFPMILTCAVFGGLVVHSLGFWPGMGAIAVGTLVLMVYVGALSYLAGRSGESFALMAMRTFGAKGYVVPAGFLATVVIGWFAFQTGLTGSTLHGSLGWDQTGTTLVAGLLFVAVTLLGIRALSWIGVVAAPLYLALGAVAVVIVATRSGGAELQTAPAAGAGALSFGAAVTLVVALFADSGTMTADFTRWARSGRQAVLATLAAFPFGNAIALVVGGLVVALGGATDPGTAGGDFLGILVAQGGALVPLAVLFVVVNLGSVCAHCLYNGAVGWSQLTGMRMRRTTLVLGAVGVVLAVAGIWTYFEVWLNLLGVIVPPIGAVLIVDQLLLAPRRAATGSVVARGAWRAPAFVGWAVGAVVALVAHAYADFLSTAVVGMVVGAVVLVVADTAGRVRAPLAVAVDAGEARS
ncbi:purine-cytosine permease family protein [Clavibacter michiganensis]|uniref:purine-cytosine permease family protein n=1 Tax=Clavibacter michiganensis TaxID=28447 RepID=UPI000A3C08B3|nr:cytosine permease [Clavibacter michiganensis]MBW8027195.1 cytosine permease [Clavibacter michiganensis subsp. michiganensis]MDO4099172.1 cytosine permease [Clavibacter michiganensis]MDO4127479.1 cytosine permease [Clavibacter michiganensis]NIY61726.1 cytosine permease [Clavibacter michiganensis subsp. michiganensis]OUE27479.1 Cytosine permease [Clavibacter michiganensis subsp. michiganensis]